MKTKKLKVYIKAEHFSLPIPALRFSTLRWIVKIAIKFMPKTSEETNGRLHHLKKLNGEDIDRIIDQLQQEEPFALIDIESFNEKGKVIVKIYTL